MPNYLGTEQDNTLVFQITVTSFGKPEKVTPEVTKTLEDALRLGFHKNCAVELITSPDRGLLKEVAFYYPRLPTTLVNDIMEHVGKIDPGEMNELSRGVGPDRPAKKVAKKATKKKTPAKKAPAKKTTKR